MLIKWEHVCYECQCPLDIRLVIVEPTLNLFLRDYGSWCYLRPFSLCKNTVYYKFYGLQVKRVCLSCPKRISLVRRESGLSEKKNREEKSKTHDEIYEYFSDFAAFRKRKDLDICIVEKYKRKTICCLELFWRTM
jgi:hypothetical protein